MNFSLKKSFKYLHVSEVLSVEKPNTCRGQVIDGMNGNTMNKQCKKTDMMHFKVHLMFRN